MLKNARAKAQDVLETIVVLHNFAINIKRRGLMIKYYVVQTKCRDGEREYSDIFCMKGENIDQVNDDYPIPIQTKHTREPVGLPM